MKKENEKEVSQLKQELLLLQVRDSNINLRVPKVLKEKLQKEWGGKGSFADFLIRKLID